MEGGSLRRGGCDYFEASLLDFWEVESKQKKIAEPEKKKKSSDLSLLVDLINGVSVKRT